MPSKNHDQKEVGIPKYIERANAYCGKEQAHPELVEQLLPVNKMQRKDNEHRDHQRIGKRKRHEQLLESVGILGAANKPVANVVGGA
ncbi:MAG TPA: hypothetical protein VLE73_02455 [Candidatus Saccharimonadales bacterium]|nr:hypothetical protein [Candidatus Saccharimonadales bacterium]